MFFPLSWILHIFEWIPFDTNPTDCFLQGVVGSCGTSVLCNLMRVHLFVQTQRHPETEKENKQRSLYAGGRPAEWRTALQFWFLTAVIVVTGSRVSSLIVLEFSLRALSACITDGADSPGRGSKLLLVQCQFSLGCALTSTLTFLSKGAPHSTLNLLLAAGLSWAIASISQHLWWHVVNLYPLHSKERYCGKCITLLTSGHKILPSLQRMVVLTFSIGALASTATVYESFLSHKDSLKLWTPLTICYAMLVVYIQGEEQNRKPGVEALLHSVLLRLGAVMVFILTAGQWADILHVLVTFLGEAVCLLLSQDLLHATLKEEEEDDDDDDDDDDDGIVLSKYHKDSSSIHTRKESEPRVHHS